MNALKISLLLHLLAPICLSVGPTRFNLEATYHIDFSTDEDGGCQSYEDQIRAGWSEVEPLITAARGALNDLQTPIKEAANENEWRRKADTFNTLFAGKIPKKGWEFDMNNDKSPNFPVSFVSNTFRQYVNEHSTAGSELAPRYYVKCTDNWLKYLGPDDVDPTDVTGNRKIRDNEEAISEARGDPNNGIYYANKPPDGIHWFWPFGVEPNMVAPLCLSDGTGPIAETTKAFHPDDAITYIITFCPRQFAKPNLLVSGPGVQIQRGDAIQSRQSALALTWIHEMGHYIKPWPDPTVVVGKKLKMPKTGEEEQVFGWEKAVLMANQHEDTVIKSPENYSLFAATMFWSDYWWVTGKALTPTNILQKVRKFKPGGSSS